MMRVIRALRLRRLQILWPIGLVCAGCSWPVSSGGQLAFQNDALRVCWKQGDRAVGLTNLATGQTLTIPVGPHRVSFASATLGGFDGLSAGASVQPGMRGQTWRFTWTGRPLPGSAVTVLCRTSFDMDYEVPWIRKRVVMELRGSGTGVLLKEAVIDSLDVKGLNAKQPFDGWQSYPVLCDGFFAGVEFPAAEAKVIGDTARLVCKPGLRLAGGQTCELKPAVFGVAPPGRSREAFEDYIQSLRPKSPSIHVQYNSWWSAPYPFTEQQMLDIVGAFREQYYTPHGGRLDSFCLDMGWARSESMWQIDEANFPKGFGPLTRELGRMNSRLALWVSPSSMYPLAGGMDNHWAARQGYETYPYDNPQLKRVACLGGPKYAAGFRDALVDHTRQYRIAHFKFDGYTPTCPESNHGHEPGELSTEKTAEGFIAACRAVRKVNPDIWLEATCFGFRPSPWWLAEVNTVIGTFGSDAPRGRVPCPVWRESAITGRDFYNLQGARDVLIPIYAQEVLGIIHQTPDPLQNDAVVSVLRGHMFIPMYVNPKHMDDRRWRFLAKLTTWARQNASLLAHTKAMPLGDWGDDLKSRAWEKPLPRDPYGYAHFHEGRGLLLLRNPWIRPQRVRLKLDQSVGADQALEDASLVCLYPEFGWSGGTYSYGSTIEIDLRPYETRLLAFGGYDDAPLMPVDDRRVTATDIRKQADSAAGKAQLSFKTGAGPAGRQLWLLCESSTVFQEPACTIRVNGKPVTSRTATSAGGWAVTHQAPEQWTWIVADLPARKCRVEVDVLAQEDVRFSAWLVAKESLPDDPQASGPIPPPEDRVLDAGELLSPVELCAPTSSNEPNVAAASQGAGASASSVWSPEFIPDKAIDGNGETRWNSAKDDMAGAWLAVDFGRPRTISEVSFIEAAGGRITGYKIQSWEGSKWRDVVSLTKLAERTKVRCRFSPTNTSRIRLLVTAATAVPTIYEIEAR
ncbi:MAG TPA: discoidin domain-containing protein, partial [Phycisphaerae bacterium]|nr:discoidin domain-containing protein [Phycisphaerae bacterium]